MIERLERRLQDAENALTHQALEVVRLRRELAAIRELAGLPAGRETEAEAPEQSALWQDPNPEGGNP